MVTNLAYFYENSKKVRAGKFVWVKDSNGENRRNILLGGTILNPNKGLGHLWAGQLMQYTPGGGVYIFRSFEIKTNAASSSATSYEIKADGFSDAPEIGQVVMKAPDSLTVETYAVASTTATKTVSDYTGQSAKITDVVYDADNEKFTITLDNTLGSLTAGDILVEATGTAKSATAKPLVTKPNIWNEADRDLLPTDGSYGFTNGNYSVSGVYDKQAWIARMQPLPKYVLAMNKSYIDGIFWI